MPNVALCLLCAALTAWAVYSIVFLIPSLRRQILGVVIDPSAWVGVDLDGTLAYHVDDKDPCHIGAPIPPMAARVRRWLAQGKKVRILTARVDGGLSAIAAGNDLGFKYRDTAKITAAIQAWTIEHFGVALPVTCRKDHGMVELWDDRAVHVVYNTGEICCGAHEEEAA